MTDKMKLLTLDDLTMGEVVDFETKSGITVQEAFEMSSAGRDLPMGVVMALAYLTEKRRRKTARWAHWEKLTLEQFGDLLDEKFTFNGEQQESENGEGDGPDPT